MDDKCAVTRGDASNPWTSGDRPEHPAPGWGSAVSDNSPVAHDLMLKRPIEHLEEQVPGW